MAKQKTLIPFTDFRETLQQKGLTLQQTLEIRGLYPLVLTKENLFIRKSDAELLLGTLKRIGGQALISVLHYQNNTLSGRKFIKKYNQKLLKANKANINFILSNFSDLFEKMIKTRIGDFYFELVGSGDKHCGLAFELCSQKSGSRTFFADVNFNIDISRGKPVLVVGNFHGFSKQQIQEFQKTLVDLKLVKEHTPAFNFILGKMISFAPKEMVVWAREPKTLGFMNPYEPAIIANFRRGKTIPATEENIQKEIKRIQEVGLKMHIPAFKKAGFRPRKGKPVWGLGRRKRPK